MSREHEGGVAQRPYTPPEGATQLIVVRHGASAEAVPGRPFPVIDGRGDPPLSDAGELQAERVCARLRDEAFSRLFVSDLVRTQQTAAPLAAATGVEPQVVPELAEVGLGPWGGGEYRIRAAAGDPIVRRVHEEERWDIIPGAEAADAFAERIATGLARAAEATGPDATAVVISHGGVIAELCRIATGCTPFAFVHADNGSITRLVRRPDGRWLVRSFNDTCHLS